MINEIVELRWQEAHCEVSAAELAAASGLTESEVRDLVDFGVLAPVDPQAPHWVFSGSCMLTVRTACRLRDEFDLDTSSLALALGLLDRIRGLESELRELRAQLSSRSV